MRGEGTENLVTTGKIQGKGDRGRQREKIIDGVCRWLGVKDNKDIFKDVPHDRQRFQALHGMMMNELFKWLYDNSKVTDNSYRSIRWFNKRFEKNHKVGNKTGIITTY
jgi:hypothetical protein